jgi:phosphoribosylamine-glycine ligase
MAVISFSCGNRCGGAGTLTSYLVLLFSLQITKINIKFADIAAQNFLIALARDLIALARDFIRNTVSEFNFESYRSSIRL